MDRCEQQTLANISINVCAGLGEKAAEVIQRMNTARIVKINGMCTMYALGAESMGCTIEFASVGVH